MLHAAERDYRGGSIFYSTQTGAKALYGPILDRYQALGGPSRQLGFPVSDQADAGNGVAHVPAALAESLPSAQNRAVNAVRTSEWCSPMKTP